LVRTRFCLIRHGATAWSVSGQHTGRSDIALTDQGRQESRELGARLRGVTIARVLCSPLLRARQTCDTIGWDAALIDIEPDLAEWDYGDYEGWRSVDIRRERPDWNLFRDGCPGGETPAEISDRVDRILARLRTLHGNIGICSHGDIGRVLAARWIGLTVEQAQRLVLHTASLSVLGYEHDRIDRPAIMRWNDVPLERFEW
jgi:broad specificity phosphatase PhoE